MVNDLYCSPNTFRVIKSRRMSWAAHVARMGTGEVYTGFWWGKPEGKRQLWRPRGRWEDNIKMDLQEVGCVGYGLDRAGSGTGGGLGNVVMNLRVP